jgi:DNA-directed RNA polymerase specialized sigma24 family protein
MASTLLEMPTAGPDVLKAERGLSALAFTRLLEWLDGGVDSFGERYLEMRQRLITYFDRRNRPFADDLADEALSRIGQTLERSGTIEITPQARYCYVVAKFVLLEDLRRSQRRVSLNESWHADGESWLERTAASLRDEASTNHDERLGCLDRCLDQLTPEQRGLIVDYYRDVGQTKIARRRDMAKRLGITMNALAIRASRIRALIESRMAGCGDSMAASGR